MNWDLNIQKVLVNYLRKKPISLHYIFGLVLIKPVIGSIIPLI